MLFYTVCRALAWPLLHGLFAVHCTGLQQTLPEGRLILCSNHQQVTDPPILACLFPRPIAYMAKSELFTDHGKAASFFLRHFGAFPVKRSQADTTSVKNAISLLEEEQVVGIFPQGGCVKPGTPFRPKAGVILLAEKTKAPILPVWISYGEKRGLRQRVTVRFGKVLSFASLQKGGGEQPTTRSMAAFLAEQMNQLGGVAVCKSQ
ncbi:MAG: lysophospholipid acyltransferase family protein [Oscillospiraceae bacterium]|nr:lysophospholipid acyltransferase family protein [Oscillospiraceae bacterium]